MLGFPQRKPANSGKSPSHCNVSTNRKALDKQVAIGIQKKSKKQTHRANSGFSQAGRVFHCCEKYCEKLKNTLQAIVKSLRWPVGNPA
jgi:hypothetical protein